MRLFIFLLLTLITSASHSCLHYRIVSVFIGLDYIRYMLCVLVVSAGNVRLQEMMGVMCEERGAKLFATDER